MSLVFMVELYALVTSETTSTRVTDRSSAEREAQQFGGVNGRSRTPSNASKAADSSRSATDESETERPERP